MAGFGSRTAKRNEEKKDKTNLTDNNELFDDQIIQEIYNYSKKSNDHCHTHFVQ